MLGLSGSYSRVQFLHALQAAINRNGAASCEASCIGLLSWLGLIKDQALSTQRSTPCKVFPRIEPDALMDPFRAPIPTRAFLLEERPRGFSTQASGPNLFLPNDHSTLLITSFSSELLIMPGVKFFHFIYR
jgi:hypothetical protein